MSSPASSDNAFTHEPLPDPARYIRLLEVLDDNHSDTIKVRCRLTTWPIDSVPSYYAISYTWGDPESNTFILMNGQSLKVRTNCEFALKQAFWFRNKRSYWTRKTQYYYWIDAICIDQTNLGEKGQQVSMMGNIYKKAAHVLACIGDHADDSLFVFETFYGLPVRLIGRDRIFADSRTGHPVFLRYCMVHRYSTPRRFLLAMSHLALRPYFRRLWILQELKNAQDVSVLCGKHVVSQDDAWTLFRGIVGYLRWYKYNYLDGSWGSPGSLKQAFTNVRFIRRITNHGFRPCLWDEGEVFKKHQQSKVTGLMLWPHAYATKDGAIFDLLSGYVPHLQCVELKDKVYGIISLIDWGDVPPLIPDYTKSDLRVAVDFLNATTKVMEAQHIKTPMKKYFAVMVHNLHLDAMSPDLVDALAARRGPPAHCAIELPLTRSEHSKLKRASSARGWCISSKDIDQSDAILQDLKGSTSKYLDRSEMVLPRWTRAGDWVIDLSSLWARQLWYTPLEARRKCPFRPLLIMRKARTGCCHPFIGYGFYTSTGDHLIRKGGSRVDIYFDVEDGVMFFVRLKQLHEKHGATLKWLLDFLNTGVCRQQSPMSSYVMIGPDWSHDDAEPDYEGMDGMIHDYE